MNSIHFFDLIGTFAFAVFGAHQAQQKSFDIFGVTVLAAISALGGGTLRELIFNNTPFYFLDPSYVITIILAVIFSIFTFRFFARIKTLMLVIDAIGLITFALIGAASAVDHQMGLIGNVFVATLTAAGGGLIRDIATGEAPILFHSDFYATPAAILGLVYGLFLTQRTNPVFVGGLLIAVFALRIVAIYYNLNLWKPNIQTTNNGGK